MGAAVTEPTDPSQNLKAAYDQLCVSYRAIDDFRAKLLGLLPAATGGGIFFLVNNQASVRTEILLPAGIFGFAVTAGLFTYEIYGIRKCGALISAGRKLEQDLNLPAGQFMARPDAVLRILDEPFAAGVIYPAVLAAWVYLAMVSTHRQAGLVVAAIVFAVGLIATVLFDWTLRRRRKVSRGIPEQRTQAEAIPVP
jgi:hypothetical protein